MSNLVKELIFATKVRLAPGSKELKNAMQLAKID